MGGSIATPPTAVLNADGRVAIFAQGTDHAAWYTVQETPGGTWPAWVSLGGLIYGSPSAIQHPDGRLEIFALGGGNGVYHDWQTAPGAAWGGWKPLGGSIATTPTVGRNDDGRLEIFAQGTDVAGWHAWEESPGGTWSGWASISGVISGSPSVELDGADDLEIFAVGDDTGAYRDAQASPGGTWSGWNPLEGSIAAAPSVGKNFDGRLEIFGLGYDGNVYHNWQLSPAGPWSGWEPLTSPSNSSGTDTSMDGYYLTDAQNNANFAAAKNSCGPPPWLSKSWAWPCGSRVNIGIVGYKNLRPFRTAVSNWNQQLLSYPAWTGGVPVQLYISAGGPQTMVVTHVKDNSFPVGTKNGVTIYDRAVTRATDDPSGRLLEASTQIIEGMTYQTTLTDTFAHELGHTFGLDDCHQCASNGHGPTVMDDRENPPGNHTWDYTGKNFTEGLPGPTTCDMEVIASNLPDYSACVPESTPPPDVPSCYDGSPAGFVDVGQNSQYTCDSYPCSGCFTGCNNFASAPCPDASGSDCGPVDISCANSYAICQNGVWVCANGEGGCPLPEPEPCYEGAYEVCDAGGWECVGSPIVLDPYGSGFHFTEVAEGVQFRLLPNGDLHQMSWPEAKFRNGWLALDRNGNGTIDDFTELFGSNTPQPPSNTPNGYLALAVFDDPNNGGNGNGAIDPGDSVYPNLRVWIDDNHNGISEPEELHTLQELGIFEISLQYTYSRRVDENGNVFRYKAQVEDESGKKHDKCYDVFVKVQ